jgi:hypothetical protein
MEGEEKKKEKEFEKQETDFKSRSVIVKVGQVKGFNKLGRKKKKHRRKSSNKQNDQLKHDRKILQEEIKGKGDQQNNIADQTKERRRRGIKRT